MIDHFAIQPDGVQGLLRTLKAFELSINNPSKLRTFLTDKVLDKAWWVLLLAFAYLKRSSSHHFMILVRMVTGTFRGRRYLLVWTDTDSSTALKLLKHLRSRLPASEVRVLRSAVALKSYPMRPRFTEAILLVDTDVTKLSSDDKTRLDLQRRIETFLLRGGGVVGTHDVIYRRTRNESLERAFGGKITNFQRTTQPVEYMKSPVNWNHPIAQHLPDKFTLLDGELLWGTWAEDAEVIFTTPPPDLNNLVVARNYGLRGGRLVWLHSCDHREAAAGSLALPQEHLIELMTASINWSSQREWKPANYPFVVAHRGVHGLNHENTHKAFLSALDHAVDFAECDVRRTADNEFVIHHDAAIGARLIRDLTFQQAHVEALSEGYELLTLDGLLKDFAGCLKLDIELKEEGYEREVLALLKVHSWPEEDFVITTFNDTSIRKIKLANATVRCGLLLGKEKPAHLLRTRLSEMFPVKRLKACGADFAAPHYKLILLGFARRLTGRGFPMWVWTVNEQRLMRRVIDQPGVEAIITDCPDFLHKERSQLHQRLSQRGGWMTRGRRADGDQLL